MIDSKDSSSCTPPVHPAPKRWLVEEHLSSGSIRWRAYEHELQARSEAAMCAAPATVTPLYVHPAPVGEVSSEAPEFVTATMDDFAAWADNNSLDWTADVAVVRTARKAFFSGYLLASRLNRPAAAAPVGERDKALETKIAEMEERLSHANDVVGLERSAREAAEATAASLLKFVPSYEPWMDKYPDHTELTFHRGGNTFGDLRAALARSKPTKEGE